MGDTVDIQYLLNFEGDEEKLSERIMKRAETEGRPEDNLTTVKKRFKHYEEVELPLIQQYADMQKVKTINSIQE